MASNLCEMPLDELFGQPRVNADPVSFIDYAGVKPIPTSWVRYI